LAGKRLFALVAGALTQVQTQLRKIAQSWRAGRQRSFTVQGAAGKPTTAGPLSRG